MKMDHKGKVVAAVLKGKAGRSTCYTMSWPQNSQPGGMGVGQDTGGSTGKWVKRCRQGDGR